MWLFPSFLNHLFLSHYLFLSVFPPKMKSVSLAPMCLQVCHTFFFLLQNPSGELSRQVSICLSFPSPSWIHFRAQGSTGLVNVARLWSWSDGWVGRHLHFSDPHPVRYERPPQALTSRRLAWQAYHMPPLGRNFQCPCRVPCQLLFCFDFFPPIYFY